MHKQPHKRAFYVLAGCIAALALCVAASLFLLTPAPKAQDVTIPGTRGDIYATVQLPGKLARGEELPLVVLCHGFTGSRSGDGHFAPLAADLAAQGIATVRLDFPGCGNSTEPFTAYTLSNMTDDVESAITYMQQTYGTGRTALVGHSMGGRLASLYPQRRGGITALALWSPANGAGLRGDLKAVWRTVLLDEEARGAASLQSATHGKVREPLVRVLQWLRTFGVRDLEQLVGLGHLGADEAKALIRDALQRFELERAR